MGLVDSGAQLVVCANEDRRPRTPERHSLGSGVPLLKKVQNSIIKDRYSQV